MFIWVTSITKNIVNAPMLASVVACTFISVHYFFRISIHYMYMCVPYTLLQDEMGGAETMETGEEPEVGEEMAVVLHEVSQL